MDSDDHEVLRAAVAWLEAGHGVSLITIARIGDRRRIRPTRYLGFQMFQHIF